MNDKANNSKHYIKSRISKAKKKYQLQNEKLLKFAKIIH